MAGNVGLRDVRYTPGQNHDDPSGNGARSQAEARAQMPEGDAGNPRYIPKDLSNPDFSYDPSKWIVCSRCVRACDEVQCTSALTIEGRGFDSRVSAGTAGDDFMASGCVSCGACVQACPTAMLQETSIAKFGTPERSVSRPCTVVVAIRAPRNETSSVVAARPPHKAGRRT